MREEELIRIWKKSSDMNQIKMNLPLLVAELRHKMENTDQRIGRRDRREIIACVIGIVAFSLIAWQIPFFWSKIACLLTIAWFAYVIYRLKSATRDQVPDSSLSLRDQLDQRKQFLQTQASMLNSVFYWYILPPFLINVMFVLGVGDRATWDSPFASFLPDTILAKVMSIGIALVLYAYITWTNRKAARTYYPPLIQEIEQVQEELQKQED